MIVEHADLVGIPHSNLKTLVVLAARELLRANPEDPTRRLRARFLVGIAERVAEFDAGEANVLDQHVYEVAVQRMCEIGDLPNPVPSLLQETAP